MIPTLLIIAGAWYVLSKINPKPTKRGGFVSALDLLWALKKRD
jgi:hypothetical protein